MTDQTLIIVIIMLVDRTRRTFGDRSDAIAAVDAMTRIYKPCQSPHIVPQDNRDLKTHSHQTI